MAIGRDLLFKGNPMKIFIAQASPSHDATATDPSILGAARAVHWLPLPLCALFPDTRMIFHRHLRTHLPMLTVLALPERCNFAARVSDDRESVIRGLDSCPSSALLLL